MTFKMTAQDAAMIRDIFMREMSVRPEDVRKAQSPNRQTPSANPYT